MKRLLFVALLSAFGFSNVARAELASGPGADKTFDPLKVFVLTALIHH